MSFTTLINAQTQWYLANRNGGLSAGTTGTALVSDLQAGDYIVGSRTTVVSTGSTVSGIRALTLSRPGVGDFTVNWTAASSAGIIIR
jgi:hypothetical protein